MEKDRLEVRRLEREIVDRYRFGPCRLEDLRDFQCGVVDREAEGAAVSRAAPALRPPSVRHRAFAVAVEQELAARAEALAHQLRVGPGRDDLPVIDDGDAVS